MINKPLVSIIVLNYNNYNDTIACLDSLLNISYYNYNIIIVDNCSTNNSVEELKEYCIKQQITYEYYQSPDEAYNMHINNSVLLIIQSGFNGGYGYGNNIGVRCAINNDADYILILNNDTIVNKNFLNPMIKLCEENSKIGVISTKINYLDKPDTIWFNGGKYNHWKGSVIHYNFNETDVNQIPPTDITFISGCLMLLPKRVIEEVGIFNENYFMYIEDLEYSYRVMSNGFKLVICNEVNILHKVSGATIRWSKSFAYYAARNRVRFIKDNMKIEKQIISIGYQLIFGSFWWVAKLRFDLFICHLKGIFIGLFRKKL